MGNISLKGEQQSDAWLTIEHHDTEESIRTGISEVMGEHLPDDAWDMAIPTLVASAQAWYRQMYALGQVGAVPIPQSPVAAGPPSSAPVATGFPDNVSQFPTPASPAPGGPLPQGVNVYAGPDPKNPQYQMLYVEYPYIRDAAARAAFTAAMKAATQNWWRWSPDNKVWLTKTSNEQIVRGKLAEHAHLFA